MGAHFFLLKITPFVLILDHVAFEHFWVRHLECWLRLRLRLKLRLRLIYIYSLFAGADGSCKSEEVL